MRVSKAKAEYSSCSGKCAYRVRSVVEELVDGACGAPDFDTRAVLGVLDLHEDVQLVAQVLPLRLAAMRVLLRRGRERERVRSGAGGQ
jgi:hypothetical protein